MLNKDYIKLFALENAIKFKGKANFNAVLGKLLAMNLIDKSEIKNIAPLINEIISEINSYDLDTIASKFDVFKKQYSELFANKQKKSDKKDLKDLPNVKDKVVLRVAPSPSGPLHIGHAYIVGLNYSYAKKYDGDLIIRIEDTNPSKIYPAAYEMIKEDANWLCDNNIKEFIIQSDRMDLYYSKAEELIRSGDIYICTCDREEFRNKLNKSEACSCRELSVDEQLLRWKKMFNSYKEGEAVARFKTDLNDKNPAMRDFPIFRINDEEHPRTGKRFRVWPLMNWSVAIDDAELGITHTLRGKDHADNAKRQAKIHEKLNVKTPEAVSVGRINFLGLDVSASKTMEKIRNGVYTDWDDIRIPFLLPLRKRGILPESLIKFAKEIGISKTDKSVDGNEFFKTIYAFNREYLDKIAKRLFFVENPVLIDIKNSPEKMINLKYNVDSESYDRKFLINGKFYVSGKDVDFIKSGNLVRLMDCLNFKYSSGVYEFVSLDYEDYKNEGFKIIHWLPEGDVVKVKVYLPDNKEEIQFVEGFGENSIKNLKIGDIVQFERFGFCRLNEIVNDVYEFWFAHK